MIALVSDSIADLPRELVEKYRIEIIPAIVIVEGNAYEDGKGLTREAFYTRMPSMKTPPTTASPSIGAFQERYEKLLSAGAEQILSIHAASTLSGIYNTAKIAAQSFGEKVRVLDSGQLTLGIGFQVLAAAEALARVPSMDAALAAVESIQKRLKVFALLDTLEYLRRSGRVSWAKAMIGGFLNLKPMIELTEGRVLRPGAARTARQGVERLLRFLHEMEPLERLAILHTNAEARARAFLRDASPDLKAPPLIVNVTTVIGAHLGPNGVGFAAVRRS